MELKDLGFKGKKLEKLNKDGISTIPELLYKRPRKYLYFDKITPLALSQEVIEASVARTPVVFGGKMIDIKMDKASNSNISITKIKILNEENGVKLYVNIFGSYYDYGMYERMLNQYVYVGGKVQYTNLNGFDLLSISNPDLFTTLKSDLRIYPIYRKYKGISEQYYKQAIETSCDLIADEYLPVGLTERFHLYSYRETINAIHFPKDEEMIRKANNRIVFDDMLYFASKVENSNDSSRSSNICPDKEDVLNSFISSLPYRLTEDQSRAVKIIKEKMKNGQTSALIQGDVSCGKTIVAMSLMILMAENDYQSVLVAPTVILARQHYEELSGYAEKLGFSVAFLSSDMTAGARKKVIKEVGLGKHLLVVGTHSCFSKDVDYPALGLVITDEEHKFGVMQRESIRSKSDQGIHTITMSATPIPRTIACSLYGNNIEVITIKQMPSGRKPKKTAICSSDKPVFAFMEKELKAGHQGYVVCPLIEEAEEESLMSGIASIEEVAEKYRKYFEPIGYKVGVITGKTPKEEQEKIKNLFAVNKIQILIATTVIEVGINVPNATVMVITSAERFGVATLHQLRGRVGRGTEQSYCILQKSSKDILSDNLEVLLKETDGFEIAKADLKNRGAGNILGVQQSGSNKFISLIIEYPKLYERVKEIAKYIKRADRAAYIDKYEEMYPSCL